MTEHIFTNYSDAADALRIKDLKQSLYDDGEVIMDQVLVCLHGEEHKKRRKLENKIFTRDKKKVKLFRLPVHSKNPLLILINIFILTFIVLFYKINILHVRSRAPAWSCYYVSKITRCKLVTTFHGTYNFNSSIKKKYNAIMLKSDCVIAGSNFIFSHIKEKYPEYISRIKKFLVIFRGINTEYYDPDNIKESDRIKFLKKFLKKL